MDCICLGITKSGINLAQAKLCSNLTYIFQNNKKFNFIFLVLFYLNTRVTEKFQKICNMKIRALLFIYLYNIFACLNCFDCNLHVIKL